MSSVNTRVRSEQGPEQKTQSGRLDRDGVNAVLRESCASRRAVGPRGNNGGFGCRCVSWRYVSGSAATQRSNCLDHDCSRATNGDSFVACMVSTTSARCSSCGDPLVRRQQFSGPGVSHSSRECSRFTPRPRNEFVRLNLQWSNAVCGAGSRETSRRNWNARRASICRSSLLLVRNATSANAPQSQSRNELSSRLAFCK